MTRRRHRPRFELSDAGTTPATPTVPMVAPSPAPSFQRSGDDAPAWVQKDLGDVTQEGRPAIGRRPWAPRFPSFLRTARPT